MGKYVLAILLSILHIVFSTSLVWAKDVSKSSASPRKQAAKKSKVLKKHKAQKSTASSSKLRSSSRRRAKADLHAKGKTSKKSVIARGKRKTADAHARKKRPLVRRTAPVLSAGDLAGLNATDDPLDLRSNAVLIWDPSNSEVLFEKNSTAVLPIASITKLMTALVVIEARQDMDEVLEVTSDDIDRIKHTSSRLRIGSRLTRANMLHIALMSSENRAASALGRNYPGGLESFVMAMNEKAKALGMNDTHYVEPTGLSSENVSSAHDLAKLVMAAQRHPVIREYSTNREYAVDPGGPTLQYRNSNRLIANPQWDIIVQKTGYISEAGRCLVMQAVIGDRSIVMVFLDAKGKLSRAADARRVRKWLESGRAREM